jgi:predicted lipoprotein with Yx(FWY)xxD motif
MFAVGALALGAMATIPPAGAAAKRPGMPNPPTASSKVNAATVTWVAPAANGAPIDQYTVVASIKGVPKVTHVYAGNAVTHSFGGLSNGTTYTFKVRAHNKVGWGKYSGQSIALHVGAPAAPAAPLVERGNETVRLHWTAPADNGKPITGYVVTPIRFGATQNPIIFNSTALTQNITGLDNNLSYKFRVAARNARGNGAKSPPSAEVRPTDVPALRTMMNASIGQEILVDADGMTVYLYTPDGSNTTSSVNGALRTAWPYELWAGPTSVGPGLDVSKAIAYVQPDNSSLLSYNGHLLYLWVGDHNVGDATGQGINNFHVLDTNGNPI